MEASSYEYRVPGADNFGTVRVTLRFVKQRWGVPYGSLALTDTSLPWSNRTAGSAPENDRCEHPGLLSISGRGFDGVTAPPAGVLATALRRAI